MKMNPILLLSAAAGALIVAMPASAQDSRASASASSGEADAGDTIVVTARRRAEDASKVPISITAFSGDQLAKVGIADIADVQKIAPGIAITVSPSGKLNPFIAIRGQSRTTTGNVSPGVLIYMNDVPLQNTGSIIQTYDMANVQVLKGPQGTLFGRNAIGGAVLANTQAPVYRFEGYVKGEFAQYGTHSVEGAINVPIVPDRIALRIAGTIGKDGSGSKGYVWNPWTLASNGAGGFIATPGSLNQNPKLLPGEYKTKSIRVSLLVEPVDGIRNLTVGSVSQVNGLPAALVAAMYPNGLANDGKNISLYYKNTADIVAQLTPSFGAPGAGLYASIVQQLANCPSGAINCNISAVQSQLLPVAVKDGITHLTQDPGLSHNIVKFISNTTTIDLGEHHQLKNIFGYTTVDYFSGSSLGGIPIATPFLGAQSTRMKMLTDELQLSGSFLDNQLKYTVGAFMLKEDPNGAGGFGALEQNAFFGLSHNNNTNYLHNRSKAIYGQFDYSPEALLPGLTLTAGLRQTWDKQSTCTTTQSYSPFTLGRAMQIASARDVATVDPTEAACIANSGLAAGAGTLPAGATSRFLPYTEFKKLTYTFGANYQITPDAMAYVAHRRGYRTGGYNTPLFDPYLASVQAFGPETLTDWEVGAKLKWQSGGMRGTLNFALFTGKDKGNQFPVSTSNFPSTGVCIPAAIGSGGRATNCVTLATQTAYTTGTPGVTVRQSAPTVISNSANLTISGFDVDATLSPTDWLTFNGGVGYVKVKADTFNLDPALKELLIAGGRPLPTPASVLIQGQPKWTVTGGVTVEYPGEVFGGRLSAGLNYTYLGSFQQSDVIIPSSKYADARVTLDDIGGSKVSMTVYVKNITDEITYPGGSSTSPSSLGLTSLLYGTPRTVGMSATFKF